MRIHNPAKKRYTISPHPNLQRPGKHKSKINFTGMQNDSLQQKLKTVQNLTSQVELWIQIHIRNTDPDPHMQI